MLLSVIIPVKNGAATLERCLQSIRNQTVKDIEIIITDTMSTDSSREIALQFGAKIIDVAEKDFDHGLTRNLGVQHCSGDLVYLTVQDAWIRDKDMLEKMLAHFDDPGVMAVTGHQAVPHEKDKNPLRWYHPYSKPSVDIRYVEDAEKFTRLPQAKQQKLVAWDNVVAMCRKSALAELPFVQTEFSEDWKWSYDALEKGWTLLRDPSLVVYHYHHQTMKYVFNTTFTVNYHFCKFFGYQPVLPAVIVPALKACYHLFRNKELNFREKIFWTWHNWMIILSRWLSDFNFLWRLKTGGESSILKGYQKYCKKIPMGRQKQSQP